MIIHLVSIESMAISFAGGLGRSFTFCFNQQSLLLWMRCIYVVPSLVRVAMSHLVALGDQVDAHRIDDVVLKNHILLPNVRDHRHRTAGAPSAGSVATKHSACQRVGVRWIALFDLFFLNCGS